jgi:hypothetical protein
LTVKDRLNGIFNRTNVASAHTYESIKSNASQLKYQDPLVKGTYHDFWDNYSRKEVALNDAVGNRITMGFMKHVLQKLPKFVVNDEIQSEYIMDDVRQACELLNLKPKFITVGTNELVSGWCLVLWDPIFSEEGLQNLSCKIFGRDECHDRYWHRLHSPDKRKVNKIHRYDAIYIPRPLGMEAISRTLSEERYTLDPRDPNFQHLTMVDRNYGFGYSRLQPIWDAMTKLRERSNDEHFLKSLFMEVRYPQSWTATGKAQDYVTKARKATRRRGMATEAVVNPQTNEDTGLPSVQFRPWGQGPQGNKVDVNQASAYLDGEWLRLLVNLGYSQMWATGGNAGAAKESSEVNLTQDDRADIAQFAVLEPSFKKILEKLTQLGVMDALGVSSESQELMLSKKYRMQCWLTWEYNDKATLQQEQLDKQMEAEKRGTSDDRNAYEKSNKLNEPSNRYNSWIETQFVKAYRENMNYPKTPVMSSWISDIASDEQYAYMETHQGYTYRKPKGDPEQTYRDWTDSGSKGGYFWDHLADRSPPWERIPNFPSQLDTGYGEDVFDPAADHKYKIEGSLEEGVIGAGETRAPFGIASTAQQQTPLFAPDDDMYNVTTTTAPEMAPSVESVATPGYITDPGITGTKKIGPGAKRKPGLSKTRTPIIPYNPTIYNEKFKSVLNSQSALLRFAKTISTDHNPTGWSMKRDTTYKIKELIAALANHATRVNRVSYGNSIKAGHPYNYGGEDEFICVKDYKKNIGKIVPLGIYHNLDEKNTLELPNWQVIGTHEVLGWDDDLGGEIAKNDYDIDKINAFFETRQERNWIWDDFLSKGMEPPISGAYTCNVPKEKINDKFWQLNIDLVSMSFVPEGNCPWDVCNFTPDETNN